VRTWKFWSFPSNDNGTPWGRKTAYFYVMKVEVPSGSVIFGLPRQWKL
jgi:hypothetical protein